MMRFDWKNLQFYLLFIPLLVLVNCNKSDGQDSIFITTNSEQITYGESLTFQFENTTSDTVAIHTSGCGNDTREFLPRFVIQQKTEGKWMDAGSPICIEIATKPITLASGQRESVQISTKLGLEVSNVPGVFRYVFDIRRNGKNGTKSETELDLSLRASPAIKIAEQ